MTATTKSHTHKRAEERAGFLAEAGWAAAQAVSLAGDASTRSYERLHLGDRQAVLMNAPPHAETAACPPTASDGERRILGYNAMARLAGPNLNAFTTIANALREAGLSAPEIYAADPASGFALIEDLGDDLFARAIPDGADEKLLYQIAIDALVQLHAASVKPPSMPGYKMLDYDPVAMEAEVLLLTEWYWKQKTGLVPDSDQQAEYLSLWRAALAGMGKPSLMVLRDYHAENLLWLPDRQGVKRIGLIDFQDGLMGHAAYDVVSLLEDARRDVSIDLAQAMIDRYCTRASDDIAGYDRELFLDEYALLGAQRNAKILGIFARLIARDGKKRYVDFLPRVEAHFRRDLERPALASIRAFFKTNLPELVS